MEITWSYMPKTGNQFKTYDPANPPNDVATTTTSSGVSEMIRNSASIERSSATSSGTTVTFAPNASRSRALRGSRHAARTFQSSAAY